MKELILVSHGEFADGLHNALSMLAGSREDIKSIGLKDGSSADDFAREAQKLVDTLPAGSEIVLLADLIGGSPLTTMLNVLKENDLLEKTQIFGGMNLPLALTAVLMKDAFSGKDLADQILREAGSGLREFVIASDEEDDI